MRLRVKITCQDIERDNFHEFIKENSSEMVKTQDVRNGIIFDPLVLTPSDTEVTYALPNNFSTIKNKVTFLMDVSEHGGFNTEKNIKYSNIVCGKSGKPLKPYFIPKKHTENPCGQHAFFSIPECCITINCIDDDTIKITENKIVSDNNSNSNTVKITHTELYHGPMDALPSDLERFEQAALVAIDKANCENCTHMHYYMDTSIYKTIRRFGT